MIDNELFELCKEVYEKTKWDDYHLKFLDKKGAMFDMVAREYLEEPDYAPLYTSDYLLEKLPKSPGRNLYLESFNKDWHVGRRGMTEWKSADTPLKALLKLTLALKEAGEL